MPPLFTIVTVCRNAETTIRRTLESVLAQTWRDRQYVVVDGASDDGTLAVVKAAAGGVDTVVSEADGGIFDAMNKGITLASGEWLLFLNADDYLADEHVLADIAQEIQRTDGAVELVHGRVRVVDEKLGGSYLVGKPMRLSSFYAGGSMPHGSAFVRRRAFERLGCYDTSLPTSADTEWFARFFANSPEEHARFVKRTVSMFTHGGTTAHSLRRNADGARLTAARHFPLTGRLVTLLWFPCRVLSLWFLEMIRGSVVHRLIRFARFRGPGGNR